MADVAPRPPPYSDAVDDVAEDGSDDGGRCCWWCAEDMPDLSRARPAASAMVCALLLGVAVEDAAVEAGACLLEGACDAAVLAALEGAVLVVLVLVVE